MSNSPDSNIESSLKSRRRLIPSLGVLALLLVMSLSAVAALRWWSVDDLSDGLDFRQQFKGGALIISGGGRLPPEIRQRFVELAGGATAKIVVIPAYAANAEQQA